MLKKKKEYKVSVLTTIISSFISAIIGIVGACYCIIVAGEINYGYGLWTILVVLSAFLFALSVTVLSVWIPATIKYGKTIGIRTFLKTTINLKNDVIIFRTLVLTVLVQIVVITLVAISLFF